jgi:hypothetical protein
MLIDCGDCTMQHTRACDDCVVTFLLGNHPVELSDAQTDAVSNLAEVGLVPRLKLVPRDQEKRVS